MRKQYLTLTFLIIFSGICSFTNSQIVVSEIISPMMVEIHNQGTDTINVDQYWLCNRPTYERIGSLNAACGNFNMAPGSFLVVTTNQLEMSRDGAEVGIYTTGDFGNAQSIVDYVIWGVKAGLNRESVAVAAGIWTQDDRAPTYGVDNSLLYDGEGNASSDYYLGQSNQCMANVKCEVTGGQLAIVGGETSIDICAGDGISDAFDVTIDSAVGTNSAWVVTDTNGVMLALPLAPPFDLDSSGAGVCLIWQVVFEDTLVGVSVDSSINNISGCFALSNSIRVNRSAGDDCPPPPCEVSGGSITLQDSLTAATICLDDGISNIVTANLSDATGTNSLWVVTDTNRTILAVDTSNAINFDSSGAGVCLIWHLSYEEGLTGAVVDSNTANLSGCFSLSNSITVTRQVGDDCPQPPCDAVGGTLAIVEGGTSIDICAGDGISDSFDVTIDSAQGTNMAWVVTDTNGVIIALPTSPPFDLEGLGAGVCLIRHLVFEVDVTGISLDANINNLEGCFAFSNAITVNRSTGSDCPGAPCEAVGGSIVTTDSTTMVAFCLDDEEPNVVTVNLSEASGSNSLWVITDTNQTILSIDTTNVFNFDSSGAGVCLIWHLSFEDGLEGAAVDSNTADLNGCFSLSNSIKVTRVSGADCPSPPCEVNGGSIMTQDSMTSISICVDDNEEVEVVINLSESVGTNSLWLITDTNLTILSIDTTNVFNFDSTDSGICRIWHLTYEDGLVGADIDSNVMNLSGCFSLSNSITVTKLSGTDCPPPPCVLEGGSIMTQDSMTSVTICVDDNEEDIVEVSIEGATGTNNIWVVTDTNQTILSIDSSNVFSYEGVASGVCLIWHVTYEDGLEGLEVEGSTNDLSGCFAFSNEIRVVKSTGLDCPQPPCEAVAGSLTISDGSIEVVVCGGSGSGSTVSVNLENAIGSRSAWVITDTSGMILGFPLAPPFNLSGARPGIYQIWHLSYDGIIMGASLGANINNIAGCLGLSNPITVIREDIRPGSITLEDGSTETSICVGDGVADEVSAMSENEEGSFNEWVITDPSGVILGLPDTLPFNFENSGPGVCLIWLVSHGGDVSGLNLGADISDLQGCFAVSNSITVTRKSANGGMLTTAIGGSELLICVGDGAADILDLELSGASGEQSAYVVSDSSGFILSVSTDLDIDFDLFSAGVCQVWHISYNDSLVGLVEEGNIADIAGCFALSNAVNVTKVSGDDCPPPCLAKGGTIMSNEGEAEITICVDDNLSDTFELIVENAEGENFAFIVSDPDGNIIGRNVQFNADLEGTGVGNLEVRHIAYSDDANIPEIGGNINTLFGCYSLSNVFTINRVIEEGCAGVCIVQGGNVSTAEGDEFTFCADDGEADEVQFNLDGNHGDTSVFVITDGAANIIRLTTESLIDFEGTGSGTCLIRNISYTGSLSGLTPGGNTEDIVGCFDLSNAITVTRLTGNECPDFCNTDGGTITSIEGDTELEFCTGDVLFTVVLNSDGEDTTSTYYYILTDDEGKIVEWRNSADGGDYDLNMLPGGTSRVYGYDSPDGSLLEEGADIADLEMIECARLSTNYVTVNRMTGGACDEGCHTPRDVRFRSIGKDRWALTWDRVSDASSYLVRVGFEGIPESFSEVPANRNRINLTGPSNRVMVFSVKAVCGANISSEYSAEFVLKLDANFGTPFTESRSTVLQHGTVLPNGIIITEQALAFPNPANDRISVWYSGQGMDGQLSIFDQTGRRVMTRRVNGNQEFHEISIDELADGIFFIMIESDGQILMQDKLIKSSR